MAITQNNLSYIGQGPTGGNQINAQSGLSGPAAKSLSAYAQLKGDGAATTVTLNFIDGVQGFGRTTVLSFTAAAAAVSGNTTYTTLTGTSPQMVGASVLIAGFATGANNGTFTIQSVGTGFIVVNNASGVLESNPAGVGTVNISSIPAFVQVSRQIQPTDTASAALTVAQSGAVTATGIPVTITGGAPANGAFLSVAVEVGFAS